ncbi:TetR/AcrR family transcriptional regulator [Streptomyces mangrovisoli]|uniref:HTH tetR-type domain-containing protein n=1 Tax=Streptomyces mangrovisoli TaxID=1428628 RepID=A0A1J4NKK0_9ACTN|nr:TetR/AcrR family transcriptional regulator [Streptomyces mangrovisoli]OIJ62847.1 hypothetical protein WN71_037200 [Streptomyces mangrovisoli]
MTEQTYVRKEAPGKREAALDAAVELFLSGGFDRTTMDAVAARAGVSKTTVYTYFGDKFGLFRAVTERAGAALDLDLDRAVLASADDPEDRLAHIFFKVLEATSAPQYLAFVRVMAAESSRYPELVDTVSSLGVPHAVDVVETTLREDAVRHGYTLPDPQAYAGLFIRMAAASVQMDALLALGETYGAVFLRELARWTAVVFLRSLRNGEAGPLPRVPEGAGGVFSWGPRVSP